MIKEWYIFLIRWVGRFLRLFSQKYRRQLSLSEFVELDTPVAAFQLKKHTNCSEIGVGVYRGEAVVFHPKKERHSHSRQWGVHKLHYCNLHRIDKALVLELRSLVGLLEHDIQSSPLKTDSQKSGVVKVRNDFDEMMTVEHQSLLSLAEVPNDSDISRKCQEQEPEESQ